MKKRIGLIKKVREKYYDAIIDIMGVTGTKYVFNGISSCRRKNKYYK